MTRLADVCVLSRDVLNKYKQKFGTVKAPIPVLKNGVLEIVEEVTRLKIEAICLPWQGSMFRGKLHRYKDSAKIFYAHELNTCWSRFVICKEASHLLCGDEGNFTSDPVTLVNGLLTSTPPGIDGEQDAEVLAMYGAMDLLVPPDLSRELYSLELGGKSHLEIAVNFMIPEKVISLRLSPGVRKVMDTIHQGMR